MTLTPTRTILDDAYPAGRGVGAFNVVHRTGGGVNLTVASVGAGVSFAF